MKTIYTLALSMLLLASCAEKNPNYKENPLLQEVPQVTAPNQSTQALVSDTKVSDTKVHEYNTRNVYLIYPNDKHAGKITFKGADAKALYNKMRISSKKGVKKGVHVVCSENKCELDIDYANGSATTDNFVEENAILPVDTLIQLVRLSGDSAQALYLTMDIGEVDVKGNIKRKTGEHYRCSKTLNTTIDDNFLCSLRFDALGRLANP